MSPRLAFVVCALLTACGDGDWRSSTQAIAPPEKPDPPPPTVGPVLHLGSPLPPPRAPQLGEITVEAVEGPLTKITSRLDNPELRTLVALPDYSRYVGDGFFLAAQVPSLVAGQVVAGGVSFDPGDLQMYGSGVSTTPVDPNGIPVFSHRGAVAASLIPWPEADIALDGGRGDTADLYARGARLGYTPLTIQTRVTEPNGTLDPALSTISVSLDPDVVLVPVQVFAINSPTIRNYAGLGNVLGNLEVWDQVPAFLRIPNRVGDLIGQTSYSFGSWFGSTVGSWGTTTAPSWLPSPLTFAAYRPQGKLYPDLQEPSQAPDNSFYFTPDSIWRDCGVQFRLVRFETVEITDDDCDNISSGPGCADKLNDNTDRLGEDLHTLCDQFESLVVEKKLGGDGNLPDMPTLIVSDRLANVGTNGQGEIAITVAFGGTGPVSCVGSQAESAARYMALAHEVGHWAGGALSDDCTTEPSGSCQIDSLENQHAPSDAECKTMRSWAIQQWSSYWLKPCASHACPPPPPVFRYAP